MRPQDQNRDDRSWIHRQPLARFY